MEDLARKIGVEKTDYEVNYGGKLLEGVKFVLKKPKVSRRLGKEKTGRKNNREKETRRRRVGWRRF